MLSRDPTYLGRVASVSGAALTVHLAQSVASGLSIINGQTYRVGQVGSFVRVPQGYQDLLGIVAEVGAGAVPENVGTVDDTGRWMTIELVGEIVDGSFERGISQYPNIGDFVHLAIEEHLRRVYDVPGQGHVTIGTLSSAQSISAKIRAQRASDATLRYFGLHRLRQINYGSESPQSHHYNCGG